VDCDDSDAANFYANTEVCDGQDNDCVGGADYDAAGELDADADGDLSCADCDDTDGNAFNGNVEQCTDTDNDCNGTVDDYLEVSQGSWPGSSIGPNAGTVTVDTITVAAPGLIDDVNFTFDITHTWTGDLHLDITSPSGTTVRLFDENQLNSAAADLTNAVFDDEATGVITNNEAAAPFTGSWLPFASLSAFDGEVAAGVWTLTVTDANNQDGGTLNSWSVDLFPEDFGDDAACGALSCDELLTLDPSAADGAYYIDPSLSGTGTLFECDMSTNGGGYTLVYEWNREDDGDGIVAFEASWDIYFANAMGVYTELTNSLRYQDGDATYDTLSGMASVTVPNSGDVLYDLHFQGTSMEASGVWFGLDTAASGGTSEELWCNDNASAVGSYSASELAGIPYTCSTYTASPNYDSGLTAQTMGGEVEGVHMYAMMADINGGDDAQLYSYAVWVR